MQTLYGLLADTIALIHFAFVLWVVVGLLVTFLGWPMGWRFVRSPWFRGAHLACIAFVIIQTWRGEWCPLTLWENDLHLLAGRDPKDLYRDSFVAYWVHRLMFFEAPWQVFVWCYTVFGALVIASFFLVPVRLRTRQPGSRAGFRT